jgi:ATP-binding cassette subfamily C protein/ATP-binding cassette subfamily C protein EexD
MNILSRLKAHLAAVALFSFIVNAMALITSLYMMQIFDRVMPSGNFATLFWLTAIALAAIVFMGFLDSIRAVTVTRIGALIEAKLAPQLIQQGLSADQPTVKPFEDLIKVKHFIGSPAVFAMLDAPWIPFFVAVLFLMHPWYGVLAIGAAAILFSLAYATEAMTKKSLERSMLILSSGRTMVDAAIRYADSAKAMAMHNEIIGRWEAANAVGLSEQVSAATTQGALGATAKSFRLAVQIAVLGLGVVLAIRGEVSSGAIIGASILLAKALSPVEQAIGSWKSFVSARAGWNSIRNTRLAGDEEKSKLPDPTGAVTLDRIDWTPASGKPVLSDVSMKIVPGEILGVIGVSASGKSTLCRLIAGSLSATGGRVQMDGADYAVWRRNDLGAAIGYLAQEVELFPASIAANIARLSSNPEMNAVVSAARSAGAHDFIMSLPNGYDTIVTPDGRNLSGGQRQRIGLARALFGKPALIVLDEPNANLDEEGDKALISALIAAKGWGAAVVLVSHRPSVMNTADRILVLNQGKVAALGTAKEIIYRFGRGANLAPAGAENASSRVA